MPNQYFKFKEFTVHQSKSAMKVCTDSCIFGAWVALSAQEKINGSVLDIGTGTGLLSLMLAQQNNISTIDTVEIDENAYQEATANFEQSNYHHKIKIYLQDFVEMMPNKLYDVIICNPPFYENELSSPNNERNIAMHSLRLTHQNLIKKVVQFLQPNGSFWVLLPASYHLIFEKTAASNNLFVKTVLYIKNSIKKQPFRVVLQCTLQSNNSTVKEDVLIIRDDTNNYTQAFINLLQPYYLNL